MAQTVSSVPTNRNQNRRGTTDECASRARTSLLFLAPSYLTRSSGLSWGEVRHHFNHAPHLAVIADGGRKQNPDGSPDYHGWPDRFGFLPSSQAVFDPVGGPGDDLCVPDATNPPSMCTPASLAQILSEDVPIR